VHLLGFLIRSYLQTIRTGKVFTIMRTLEVAVRTGQRWDERSLDEIDFCISYTSSCFWHAIRL
jgi:hypothetical protein